MSFARRSLIAAIVFTAAVAIAAVVLPASARETTAGSQADRESADHRDPDPVSCPNPRTTP